MLQQIRISAFSISLTGNQISENRLEQIQYLRGLRSLLVKRGPRCRVEQAREREPESAGKACSLRSLLLGQDGALALCLLNASAVPGVYICCLNLKDLMNPDAADIVTPALQ